MHQVPGYALQTTAHRRVHRSSLRIFCCCCCCCAVGPIDLPACESYVTRRLMLAVVRSTDLPYDRRISILFRSCSTWYSGCTFVCEMSHLIKLSGGGSRFRFPGHPGAQATDSLPGQGFSWYSPSSLHASGHRCHGRHHHQRSDAHPHAGALLLCGEGLD